MNLHFMLDIETMGKKPGCLILSIGLQKFTPNVPRNPEDPSVYYVVDPLDQLLEGFTVDPSTQKWWSGQRIGAAELTKVPRDDRWRLETALGNMNSFVQSHLIEQDDHVSVWAKSPDFDCAILEFAYEKYKLTPPWKFYEKRDVRTALDMPLYVGGERVPWANPTHNAIEDVRLQIDQVNQAIKNTLAAPAPA